MTDLPQNNPVPERLIIVGSGSIATRHVRLWRQMYPSTRISRVKTSRRRAADPKIDMMVDSVVEGWEAALAEQPQAAIVANAAVGHLDALRMLIRARIPVMVEKPIADSSRGLMAIAELAERQSVPVLVGYCLRFHPLIRWAFNKLEAGEIGQLLAARAIVGQHLESWRPGNDANRTIGANHHLGGGVLRELSHEIDLALAAGGPTTDVTARVMKSGTLTGDAEDLALVLMGHTSGTLSEVSVNMLERPPRRSLTLIGERATAHVDLIASRASIADSKGSSESDLTPPSGNSDIMYIAQLEHFVSCAAGKSAPLVTIQQGIDVVRVIEMAEQSSLERREVVAG